MSLYEENTLLSSAARTTTGEGLPVTLERSSRNHPSNAKCYLNVSAQSGTTPTLDVDIVGIINGVDFVINSFTQVGGATGKQTIDISNCPEKVKAAYTIAGGSPSYTFEVYISR